MRKTPLGIAATLLFAAGIASGGVSAQSTSTTSTNASGTGKAGVSTPASGDRSATGSGSARASSPAAGQTATPPRGDALGPGSGSLNPNVPAIGGVTPNRAELPSSAFTKLDAQSRGYVTLEDVRQLDGFESAFRQADQNRDGRLNASEFNSAWDIFTRSVR